MSKKYTKKSKCVNPEIDRYLCETEEGGYITKNFKEEVKGVYIYSTIANVIVLPTSKKNITATLIGVQSGMQYFDMFRLDEDMLYIFATYDVDTLQKYELLVFLPKCKRYNIQIVTNCGHAKVEKGVLTQKSKIETG